MKEFLPWLGVLVVDTWGGRFRQHVDVTGETLFRYRIRAIQRTQLAGRDRWLEPGQTALVPKRAIERPR
jgi:hypothetical protein